MISSYSFGARRRLPAAVALFAGLATAAPALADTGNASVVWLASPSIVVEGNGAAYNSVHPSSQNIEGQIRVELDADVSGRVKSWEAWPILRTDVTDWKVFKGTGISRSKSYNRPRPKTVDEAFTFSIPWVHYAETAIAACNAQATQLRSQGLSNGAIFGADRSAKVEAGAGLVYEMSGPDWLSPTPNQINFPMELAVICKGIPPRVPNPIADSSLLIRTGQANNHSGACELRLHGVISTHTPNVQVKFRYVYGDGQQSDLKTVTTDAQGFVNFTHEYPLPMGIKSGKIRMVGSEPTFQSDWENFAADCGAPTDKVSVLPPKAAAIIFGVREEVAHRGLLCPSVISVEGLLEGRGKASGAVSLFAGGQLKKLQQYSIDDGQSVLVVGEHALTWGPTQAQQNVKLSMNVTNASAAIVAQLEKSVNVACRQVQASGLGQGAAGGLSGAQQPSTAGTAAAQLAAPQGFTIQAPAGLVRKGEIRLSGGAANASYSLKFLRKNGGSYVAVNAAQLPKQMSGLVASFPLQAMTGGREWRIEVCPAKQDGAGGGANACKTADFRLTRIGAGTGEKAPTPAPAQPQGTVFIFPGAAQ